MPQKVFLKAHWKNLLLFNFKVPDEALRPYLPHGCELDRFEGSAVLSLVGFQFLQTKVLGIGWPGFKNFPEINLRFYVQKDGERGVCFVREYVPSRLVAAIARGLYNEPYKSAAMPMTVRQDDGVISARYDLKDGDANLVMAATAGFEPFMPALDSNAHFFKEHELGVGKDRRGKTTTYRVHHPHWRIFPVRDWQLEVDWARIYGESFAFLANTQPHSVCFAEGSEIKVFFAD